MMEERRIKVLWFSNTSCAAFTKNDVKGTGGWMVSLDRAIQDRVELHVAFHYPRPIKSFKVNHTVYHPIYIGNILVFSLKKKINNYVIDSQYLEEYLSIVKDVKPDVIHIHGTENSFHRIIRETNIPVVVSIQGNLTVYENKYLSGFHGHYMDVKTNRFSIKSFLLGRESYTDKFRIMKKMAKIEREGMIKAKYIIGRTDWDRRITRVLSPESKYFVGNEILRDSFYTTQWDNRLLSDRIIIHTTSGNNYYKGFETICHALYLLQSMGINVEWRVAGVSENSSINLITQKLLKTKYPHNGLVLMGSLNEFELISTLKEADIYVMASHIENSPNNLCEAMILGMPCIATFAGGTSSLLTDKQDGLLIQDGDPWSMAGAIVELINDWSKAVQYGLFARKRALIRHNKDQIVQNLIHIYNSILNDAYSFHSLS